MAKRDKKKMNPMVDVRKLTKRVMDNLPKYFILNRRMGGVTFAVDVDKVKRAFANLIDMCNDLIPTSYLGNTLKGMAIRGCIEAQMAVVKLITFKEK